MNQTNSTSPRSAPPSSAFERFEARFRILISGKTRIVIAWIFAALLILNARKYPAWPGVFLCLVGATLRYWASGYLRKDSKPAVGGPYALTRNPLYLGTYLMAVGTALSIQHFTLFVAVSVVFAVIYHYIILDEEIKLERLFGAPYLEYKKAVPRFFPRFSFPSQETLKAVNPDPAAHEFSKELLKKNKAYEAYVTFFALIGFVALTAYLWKNVL